MLCLWGPLFDYLLHTTVITGQKPLQQSLPKIVTMMKLTTACVLFCLLSQYVVSYKEKITTSKSKASKTSGVSFLVRIQSCNSPLKQYIVQYISTPNLKTIVAYLALMLLLIFGTLCGKYGIQKETGDTVADPRNSQNKMVHCSSVPSGSDPKDSVTASSMHLKVVG